MPTVDAQAVALQGTHWKDFMNRSDQLRSELARLIGKRAPLADTIAKQEKIVATARESARKKRDAASRTKSSSSARSSLSGAEGEDRKVASAEAKISKARKDSATLEKNIAAKSASLSSAETAERKALTATQNRENQRRHATERTQARELARISAPVREVRYVEVSPPEPEKLRVLYLTSNPQSTESTVIDPDGSLHENGTWLRVDQEVRQVKQSIQKSRFRDLLDVEHLPAATHQDLVDGLNEHRPHLVHFSGHADGGGLLMENTAGDQSGEGINFDLLARTLAATDTPPSVVVLNACESLSGAEELLRICPIVIGMSDSIGDLAAVAFASAFYAAIASAQSISSALEQAKISMTGVSLGASELPEIRTREGVDPSLLVLVTSTD